MNDEQFNEIEELLDKIISRVGWCGIFLFVIMAVQCSLI